LVLYNDFNGVLTYFPFFRFESCETVVFYITLLEVAHKLSHLCKMARRKKAVGPHWPS